MATVEWGWVYKANHWETMVPSIFTPFAWAKLLVNFDKISQLQSKILS